MTYSDDYPLPDNGDFYVVFEGKSQRHVTVAQQINLYTLRAIVPGKDEGIYSPVENIPAFDCHND